MHRRFGNRRVEYRDHVNLMYHPSNMGIGLCWCQKGTNNKWCYDLTKPSDGKFGNNNYNNLYDIYGRLGCL